MKKPSRTVARDNNTKKATLDGTSLLVYLAKKQKDADAISAIYREVNQFVATNQSKFRGQQFASQWGAIRSIATTSSNYEDLMKKLFSNMITVPRDPTPDNPSTSVKRDIAYLAHGIAAERWKKMSRKDCFEKFVNHIHTAYHEKFGDITVQAVINLASEMAKICKQ